MTFLQFVCAKLLGGPAHKRGQPGEWWWHCPFHEDDTPSLHTLPVKAGKRDYWRCFGCNRGGDDLQLMRYCRDLLCHPLAVGGFNVHQATLEEWRGEWERLNAQRKVKGPTTRAGGAGKPGAASSSSFVESVERETDTLMATVEEYYRDLSCQERNILVAADRILASLPRVMRQAVIARCVKERVEEQRAAYGALKAAEESLRNGRG